jgi:exosortase
MLKPGGKTMTKDNPTGSDEPKRSIDTIAIRDMKLRHNSTELKSLILAISAAVLFFAAYMPALKLLVNNWWSSDEYQHAFLVLPILLYMIWGKRKELMALSPRFSPIGLIMMVATTPLYLFSLLANVQTIIWLSMVLMLAGATIYFLGMHALKILAIPFLIFLLLIPIPEQLYVKLTFPLQIKVSQISELIIRAFGIPILREGNIMSIPGKSFEVIEACSGMRSMVTLITLALILGYFIFNRITSRLFLLIVSIPTAVLMNVIRVASMILCYHYFRLDLTEGVPHTVLGLFTFGIAIAILFSMQKVLEHWEKQWTKK